MENAAEFHFGIKWDELDAFTQAHWKASWYASRESLVIELPHAWTGRHKMTGDPLPHGLMNSTEVREAIEAAGLKVKP